MPQIDQIEKATQNRVIKFFVDKLNYTYLGDLHDSENSNIMQEHLYAYLTDKGGYSGKLARRAIDELVRTAGNLQHGLYDANKDATKPAIFEIQTPPAKGSKDNGLACVVVGKHPTKVGCFLFVPVNSPTLSGFQLMCT